ncbi:3-phosphoglycerate dehydrogenase [Myxococcota bacterium]|nr:3-phosphoglycerate dehydrogenase [Myxococcota bacterium]
MPAHPPRIQRGPLTRALVVENPDPSLDDRLRAGGLEVVRFAGVPDEDGLVRLLQGGGYHLLFKRSQSPVTARVLDAAPELLGVMLCCIGDDSVDKEACAARGVLVMNDPRSNGRSVAEMVVGELLCGARGLPRAFDEARRGVWAKSAQGRFELKGKVLGVVGLGSIGKQVARLAESIGMSVLFFDTHEVAREVGRAMEWEAAGSLLDLFKRSDAVSLHLSAEDQQGRSNAGLIGAEHLASLGKEREDSSPRIFVNAARGFLHRPEDLLAAVEAGAIRAAFVDVYPEEPREGGPGWSNPYAGEPRVLCTPHIGAATAEAQPRIAEYVAATARLFSQSGTVRDCVFSPRHRIDVASEAESPYVLAVVHSDARGTKKAVDDAIYDAGCSNLQSIHRDFPRYGVAYELSVLDRPLADDEIRSLIAHAARVSGEPDAIRAVRQIVLPSRLG